MKIKVLLKKLETGSETSYLQKQTHLAQNTNAFLDLNPTMASPKTTKSTRVSNIQVNENDLIFDLEIKGPNEVVATESKSFILNSPMIQNDTTKCSSRLNSPLSSSIRKTELNIFLLKSTLCKKMQLKADSLEFYDFLNKNLLINDSSEIDNYFHSKTGGFNLVVFYYNIGKKQIIVELEYFQNNI